MMFKTQINIFNIIASTNANQFIYYFKRIPLIGKILPDNIYGNIALKKKVAVISAILKILEKFVKKGIYVGLAILLPLSFLSKETPETFRFDSYVHLFFVLNLIIGSFLGSASFETKREKYICIRLMRMNPKSYILSTVIFNYFADFVCFLPALMICSVWLGGSALQGFVLAVLLFCFRFIGETFHLLIYAKTGVILCEKFAFTCIFSILGLAAAYLPVWFHRLLPLNQVLFSIESILFAIAMGALCAYNIIHFNQYQDVALATLKASKFSVDSNQAINESRFSDVIMREKDFTKESLNSTKFENKKGYAYLNAIFFERHKRLLLKPIFIQMAIIVVLFLASVIATFVFPEFTEHFVNLKNNILPLFVFIMYSVSIGERVCKAMFYNCDISLMRYPFYRDKNAILHNFKVRLLKIAGLNLVTACTLSAAVVGFIFITGSNWPIMDIVFFVLSLLFLSLFFTVHHLFLYYVFQPYTTELGMKSPYFSIINSAVYLLCFLCLKIKSAPPYFALIVLACTMIYITVALILIYKFAPKTFRVK